ncbi:MAG: hypothetical protein VKL59_18480 [Nostocaceae cyanobacterium]|nr:hypothetical protein [Nostocaceae cyanobacterium]
MNQQISLLELIKILEENCSSIILNLKELQSNYRRQGIKRVNGVRDENGNLIKPWLDTEYIDNSDYVGMGKFEINRNTATINMLINRQVKLVKSEDKTPIIELAGLLVNDLETFNNYTIVSDGELNVKSLKVKISNKKVFELLKKAGVWETVDKFDFRQEYTIKLDNLPLVTFDENFSSIDGLFWELAELKVLKSIISAHLKHESDVFIPEQLDELKKHYLSKNIYLNFPTTNEYTDIKEALATGAIDSRVSYKIDIGSKDILNFGKFPSANKFLARRYEAYNWETGEIFLNPTFDIIWDENIAFRHKQLSSRIKITAVDEFIQPIFDDFIGLADNGKVTAILTKVRADILLSVLQDVWGGKAVSKDEMVTALTLAYRKIAEYMERIYQDKISPLVFYIGATGLLPDEMDAQAFSGDELLMKYPKLLVSKYEREGRFLEVGDTIISVYAKLEYYSTKPLVGVSNG